MSRRAARTDSNHAAVIKMLRQCGWHVHDTSALGNGFFDCVAARYGCVRLIEIKDGASSPSRRRLTLKEQMVHRDFKACGATVVILESVEQATQL